MIIKKIFTNSNEKMILNKLVTDLIKYMQELFEWLKLKPSNIKCIQESDEEWLNEKSDFISDDE